jgi:CheY-like chemotaxis protein
MSRVLVVDDSQSVLHFLRAVLEGERHEVATAADGKEALEKIRQLRPDVVVTDSVMPHIDGYELVRALREDPATADIPVIMLTSADKTDPAHANREAQPEAFVKKSADFGPLLAEIESALQRRHR